MKTNSLFAARAASGALVLGFGLAIALAPRVAHADTRGRHAHYLHALSDLRLARAYVVGSDERKVMGDEMDALVHIDRAIGAAQHAATDDRKDLRDHPPIDINLGHKNRLQKASELLVAARQDLTAPEDDGDAREDRRTALAEIGAALKADRHALRDDRSDDRHQGSHPHYLHALSDLRLARGYVIGEDENNVMGDDMQALVKIDAAIGDIKRAAVDDGKDLRDHPPIDANLRHKDRLQRAAALLSSAHNDLLIKEDDHAALHWRGDALRDVDAAARAVRHAMGDDHRDDRRYNDR